MLAKKVKTMDIKTISMTILAIAVAGVVLGASLPLVASIGTETVSVENEGAQWVRMAYVTDNSDYSFSVSIGDNVTITNGANTQTGEYEDMVIYADSDVAIFISGDDVIVTGSDGENTDYRLLGDNFTVSRSSGSVSIQDGDDNLAMGSPTWAYVPIGTGNYSSFANGGLERDSSPLVAVGSFAGVYCYNNYVTPDVGLVMDANVTSEYITSVRWALESDIENELLDFDPGLIDFDPGLIQPIDINPIDPGNEIMAVPTPSYTDGDWGYNLVGSNATIVSYSGAGGDVVIPSTVGGHDVKQVGIGESYGYIFQANVTVNNLVISEGITKISTDAFYQRNLTGTLTLPSTLTSIGTQAFYGCAGLTGALIIPSGVSLSTDSFFGCTGLTSVILPDNITMMPNRVFQNCMGLTGALIIPSTVTYIGSDSFKGCSGLDGLVVFSNATPNNTAFSDSGVKGILNFSSVEYTTTSYGLNADEVRTDIEASNYLALASYHETVTSDSPTVILLDMLPLIMALGLVIACGVMISRRW